MSKPTVAVIGAGFAGCEASYRLARRGFDVALYEMKPKRFSPAHSSENLCEIVCSNSFKAKRVNSASGLLKTEMRLMGSLCLRCADLCEVPAGGALAVDRDVFSELVTKEIVSADVPGSIRIVREEVSSLPEADLVIIAAGPLISDALAETVRGLTGGFLSFYDAAAPIVAADSIDMSRAFTQSRYGRGGEDDYINCPLDKEEYGLFISELAGAERAVVHEFDKKEIYEGCMPIEVLASRGTDAARYGPMKPVGLTDPATGRRPWANVQLRRENAEGTMYNLVGFQTNLKFSEQKRVFGLIPALKNAEYERYGVMHRNSFLNSPGLLEAGCVLKNDRRILFAGQITGCEGYMESA
ncbi:MAG: methylenetetrahydrofolate--tRNA-(uracil(54)-C(5))-methyltransferase (FADH(2)-oxidizing) TrmFO, partial [Clostridia bacterium]|nr:methylenetetrahydrofolate--tRNA-(uracil(54)-C(5))-methyltransferase (FADH(2)-oxidizing) TrmFO [Clostridia bacterium]